MMNRKEFQQYLQDTIKDFLPDSYEDSAITFHEVVKNNDHHLTGIQIARPGENVVPNIYIENYWNEYQAGKDIDHIVGEIADIRIECETPDFDGDITTQITNYKLAKENLQIHLCDTKENQERLQGLVHTEHSDYSATYHVNLQEGEHGIASTAVTPMLLDTWGITVEQLHADALAADRSRGAILCDMGSMMESMMFGQEPENLLNSDILPEKQEGMGMYCLTNNEKMNGAGLILQEDMMEQIGEIVGGNFYILPSSCHEILIVPDTIEMSVKDLSAMVYEINRTQVEEQDRLSDHVQHYDSKEAVMENAEKRASRLEKEKVETKAAKKSIHDRLGEKKQQSAEMKAGKTAEKAVKKDKGQEL